MIEALTTLNTIIVAMGNGNNYFYNVTVSTTNKKDCDDTEIQE